MLTSQPKLAGWLSDDGKTLTVWVHYASAQGDVDQKLTYEKQESGAPPVPAKAPEFE